MKGTDMTWEQIKEEKSGTILRDVFDEGVRFIVMRGPASLCAYVGIPLAHPLAGRSYDDLPVRAHGGLTFASEGRDTWPKDFYWYGWDYAHAGDYSFGDDYFIGTDLENKTEKKWLVQDVIEDSQKTLYDFKQLVHLAEEIKEVK